MEARLSALHVIGFYAVARIGPERAIRSDNNNANLSTKPPHAVVNTSCKFALTLSTVFTGALRASGRCG
uniref:Uncharacterized protein n=1 Tax=Peronospora matthiolae TaxID=2874970 RepID=A0AAV1UQ31_9STRA